MAGDIVHATQGCLLLCMLQIIAPGIQVYPVQSLCWFAKTGCIKQSTRGPAVTESMVPLLQYSLNRLVLTSGMSSMSRCMVMPARHPSAGGVTSTSSCVMMPMFMLGPSCTRPWPSTKIPCKMPHQHGKIIWKVSGRYCEASQQDVQTSSCASNAACWSVSQPAHIKVNPHA
jgi:hypothetical protein